MDVAGGGERDEEAHPEPLFQRRIPPALRTETVAAFRVAARSLTDLKPGGVHLRPRKRTKAGGGGKGIACFTARSMAADYLKLCRNPVKYLPRWLAEDKKKGGGPAGGVLPTTRNGGTYEYSATQAGLAAIHRLCRQSLPPMRGWLDANRERGRGVDGMPARPRAGAGRYDPLRSFRGEGTPFAPPGAGGRGGLATAATGSDLTARGERTALRALYAAKVEATQRCLPQREIAAAVRAVIDDERAAMRALMERQQAAQRAIRERRQAERFSARLAAREAVPS